MSRFTETEETCNNISKNLISFFDKNAEEISVEEIQAAQISGIINILTEIALSMAMIADELEEE